MSTDRKEETSDRTGNSLGRRGLVAAAWTAVLALVMKKTTQPVQAAAGLQFQNEASNNFVSNQAGGPTSIIANVQYPSTVAAFTGLAGNGASRIGCAGGFGNAYVSLIDVCGVLGYNFSVTKGPGVLGLDWYSTEAGVIGRSGSLGDGSAVGVQGESGSGVGVRGLIAPNSSSNAIAVYGLNNSSYAGPGPGAGGFGVYGLSAKGHGLVGATAAPGGAAVVGATNGVAGAFAGAFYGPVVIGGDLTVFGAKSAAVPHPDGSHRLLYCVESPESWFEDFGKGTLECGRAEVALDPDFAAIVDLSDYHVFLTAYDHEHALHVRNQTPSGFAVEADAALARLKGQKESDLTGRFSWRVVAKRTDIEAKRLAPATMPPEPTLPDLPAQTAV